MMEICLVQNCHILKLKKKFSICELSCERVWLRFMIQHIRKLSNLSFIKDKLIILHENNATCVAQVKGGYIKGDRTKHISTKLFNAHEL